MKRSYACALVGFLSLAASNTALGQCANNNTVIAGGAITPACPGTTNVPCVQGGQYALVNVTNGSQYTFSTCGATFDTQITLYNNTGGGSLGYNDDACGLQSSVTWTATFSGQLRVLVDQFSCATNAVCAPLVITCALPPPPVTNTNPCSALSTPLVLNCGGNTYSNVGGGNSGTSPAPTCGSYTGASQDVWFSFVAGPYGTVNLSSLAGTLTDGVMAVYSAPSCSGPFTQIGCDDDSGPGFMPQLSLNGLTPGQTYYIRFWGYGNATGTFNLCVQGVATVPPGGCVYMLNLYDSFGDGWGSSNVGVSINGGAYTYYTVAASSNFVAIPAVAGAVIVLNYNNSGAFQGENSYTLTLGAGPLFISGSPPAAGIAYAGTLTCVPPPAPPEDCVGSVTVCSGQSFNNTTNNTGIVADLNATSAGCLSDNERQGTWYNFTVSSSGQVAFDINPTDPTDDYDFAIWGPYPPGSTPNTICPPLSAPVRCSYAAPAGTTGLNYSATDLTEDALGDKWVRYLNATAGQVYLLYISNWSQSGVAFDLTWNLQGGASLDCTILGLELIGPTAQDHPDAIDVSWTAIGSTSGLRFQLERAGADGRFAVIGEYESGAGQQADVSYRHRDHAPLAGLNRYRLRLENSAGERGLSPEAVAFHGATGADARLVPNPASDQATLTYRSAIEGQVLMEVFDADGRVRMQSSWATPGGYDRHDLDLANLPEGLYLARLATPDGHLANLRLVIVR
ncbi:MAG: T9SS type A sorting domain-containing protein [Flavobacteriales bacterium]|nr:T9SS type A sorting domain-containing protein [Flavobacteriales bacterium]